MRSAETTGMWLGFLGVLAFGITLPMTRLAVGPVEDPQLDPTFVMAGRAAIAGLLSVFYLLLSGVRLPQRHHWRPLLISAVGTVLGFPLFLSLALRHVASIHAAVITGILPLVSAIAGAIYFRQRPSSSFWSCAVLGCALVVVYAFLRGGGQLGWADWLLLCAIISASIGYAAGVDIARDTPAPVVICWVLVLSLPFTTPVALATLPSHPIRWQAWGGLAYVSLFSMWIGFFAWYRGLAMGGMVRVSQIQLLQPFIAMIAAIPLVGERIDWLTLVFALAVLLTVFMGRRMPIDT